MIKNEIEVTPDPLKLSYPEFLEDRQEPDIFHPSIEDLPFNPSCIAINTTDNFFCNGD